MAWLTASQALAALGVQPQTLYANVSRGRIQAKPDPQDPRRSLYKSEDVKRLAGRKVGRRTVANVAAEAIGWGDPVLPSSISTMPTGACGIAAGMRPYWPPRRHSNRLQRCCGKRGKSPHRLPPMICPGPTARWRQP